MRPKGTVPLLWCRYRRVEPQTLVGRASRPPYEAAQVGNLCHQFKNFSEPGQEANNRLLPSLVRGDGAALGAMVRKIFKNDARAVILP